MALCISNNPDIGLAQEWIAQIHQWIARHGLVGYDPFDIKAHGCLRWLQTHPLPRKASTAACDLFPLRSRKMLRIKPSLNPKALALTAIGHLRLFQVTGDSVHLDNGRACLQQLEDEACAGFAGPCWGYPFPVQAVGLQIPAGTPVTVVSAIAGEAFLLAHAITRQERYAGVARGIATFMLRDLPRLAMFDNTWCFAYGPTDRRRVHNANLLTVEHIMRTAAVLDRRDWIDEVAPALAFTLSRQGSDGAWTYGVHAEGDPHESALLRLVDHHHTGFVLRSLQGIHTNVPSINLKRAIVRGFGFYKKLVRTDGMPVNQYGAWPVDIHACAEGILCPSVLAPTMPDALFYALLVMRWTHFNLRDRRNGAPLYRKYPGYVSPIVFPRWGVAWMYRALAEYLYARRDEFCPVNPRQTND